MTTKYDDVEKAFRRFMKACDAADVMCVVVRYYFENVGTPEEHKNIHVQSNLPSAKYVLKVLGEAATGLIADVKAAGPDSAGNTNRPPPPAPDNLN